MRQFLGDRSGQALLLTAIAMPVLVSMVGLAVDVGFVEYSTYKLHVAAESAVLASVLEANSCRSFSNCSAMQQAALSAAAESGASATTLGQHCASPAATGITLVLNNPPCANSKDPNLGNSGYVEVLLYQQVPLYFLRLVGVSTFTASTRAEAAPAPNPNCIYALDPSGANAITVDALASVTASCGVVDESSSASAFSCALLSSVNVSQIRITGGLSDFLCSTSPAPRTGARVPVPADPLAYLPTPPVSSCGSSLSSPYVGAPVPLVLASTVTLYPGAAYCGGITILPGANVTFMPGTYILRTGGLFNQQGGLTVSLGARVSGAGVTFYNQGPAGAITFLAPSLTASTVSLTAPSSGTYAGVLFFQDAQNSNPATILGASSWNTTLEGAFYFPNATLTEALSGPARYNILVAKDIHFALLNVSVGSLGATTLNANYSSLSNGSPVGSSSAVLVQ